MIQVPPPGDAQAIYAAEDSTVMLRQLRSEEAGRQFDERCVAALERVLRREQPELALAV